MENLKNKLNYFLQSNSKQILFFLFLNICFVFFITLSSYTNIPLSGVKDRFMYFLHLILLQLTVSGFIFFLCVNKWLFRLIFLPIFFVLSLVSYWVYTQDISITNTLIQSVLETKSSIVLDLLTPQYILFIVILVSFLYLLDLTYKKVAPIRINVIFIVFALICISLFRITERKRYNTLRSRLPYNVFFGVNDYFKSNAYVVKSIPISNLKKPDNLKIILVLGETVRADHLGINGYSRNTTPLLNDTKNIVSYKNITTPYTTTASSLPRILSDFSVNESHRDTITSVFSVFNSNHFNTYWYGNQELELNFGPIAKTNKKVVLVDSLRSVFSFKKALDQSLLLPFKTDFLKERKGLFSLHMMGSHWWYENRYSNEFRKFKPVIDSKHIPSLTANQLINSYDNTILYLDYFLKDIIEFSKDNVEPTILIYISDHGEILGENNKWLHAQKSEAAQNPAMLVWYSNSFSEAYPNQVEALKSNKNNAYTTDIIFNSLLNLINVQNIKYSVGQSIFN